MDGIPVAGITMPRDSDPAVNTSELLTVVVLLLMLLHPTPAQCHGSQTLAGPVRVAALASHGSSLAKSVAADTRADQSTKRVIERLRQAADVHAIRDTAALGGRGVAAAPVLAGLLAADDWKIRVHAARALGFIGEASVASALIEAMLSPADVNLNWAAAISLGRLRVPASARDLERVAGSHWHPAVRSAAARALREVSAGGTPRSKAAGPSEFFLTLSTLALDCPTPRVAVVSESESHKLYADQHPSRIAGLRYTRMIVSYDPPERSSRNASGIIKVTADKVVRQERIQPRTPDVALRVDGGWLVGIDRGEWGGELAYIGAAGSPQIIFEQNVHDLFRLGDQIVVVSGLAHLTSNEGMVYRLQRRPDGAWLLEPWRALPGAPKHSGLTPDGRLLVNTRAGGAVLIDAQGGMSMAPCAS